MPRQSDLRFTFQPLKGDAFNVVSFRLDERLSQPFKLTLELASHNAAIDFNNVLDLSGLFTIWRGETPARYVHGLASQLPPVISDELLARGDYRMPVHACGYNWLDSKKIAAQRLAERIDELMHQYGLYSIIKIAANAKRPLCVG